MINGMPTIEALHQAFLAAEQAGHLDASIPRVRYPWSDAPHKPIVRRLGPKATRQKEDEWNRQNPFNIQYSR